MSYREVLLNLRARPDLLDSMQNWAVGMRESVLVPYFGAHVPRKDDLELALYIYDEANQEFKQVLECHGQGSVEPAQPLTIPLGEGVVGAAFKRSDFVIYIDPALVGADAAYLFQPQDDAEWAIPEWKFVWAVPIFAFKGFPGTADINFGGWGPQATVGVLTISSKASDSGLLKFAQASKPEEVGTALAGSASTGSTASDGSRGSAEKSPGPGASNNGEEPGLPSTPGQAADDEPSPWDVWANAHVFLDFLTTSPSSGGPPESGLRPGATLIFDVGESLNG